MIKEIADTTSQVVMRAASILEEEIAAGIIAARDVEKRFMDVKKTREGNPEEVMVRFRRDAHDVIDIAMDLLSLATKTVGGLAQGAITIVGGDSGVGAQLASAQARVPTLSPSTPAHAGAPIEIPMSLSNDSDEPTAEFAFHATDLIDAIGSRIHARHIAVTPAAVAIAPRSRAALTITINVPEGTAAGVYTGLLQATKMGQLRAILVVPIE